MSRSRTLVSLLIAILCGAIPPIANAQVTADDFLPVVQGGPSEVKQPEKVKAQKNTITASTAQDAINAAVQQNEKAPKAGDTMGMGVTTVKFPSGMGIVATGMATYRTMENPTATRLAKRKAYVIGFTQAKKNLAEHLQGLSNEGKDAIRTALASVTSRKEDMTNLSTQSEESLQQATEMMLRGFVIYKVKDDVDQKTVYVTIVTTPKTRGKLSRPAPNAIEVDTIREGLNQVIAEVRSGLLPPIGGRIIMMRATGETAFVGFGSAVIRTSSNAAVQAKLNYEAVKAAGMRSKDALCGLMLGDAASWSGGVRESLKDEVQEFEAATADDPLAESEPGFVRRLSKAREEFVSGYESTDLYQSIRRGVLPPGIKTQTWFDEDNAWAYGMSVYVPSAANAAASAAREMQEGRIMQPIDDGSGRPAAGDSAEEERSSGFTDEQNDSIPRPGKSVKAGPTGTIVPE